MLDSAVMSLIKSHISKSHVKHVATLQSLCISTLRQQYKDDTIVINLIYEHVTILPIVKSALFS